MELADVEDLLTRIKGCTFASLDAITHPRPGVRKETTGARVILFTNQKGSGYERMVKRRLAEEGKNPDDFVLSDLPWGSRVPNTPIIESDGLYYIQTILLDAGEEKYFIGRHEITDPAAFGIRERRTNQGLPPGREVLVCTYSLKSIVRLTLLGEDRPKRSTLRLRH